jgi:hypothetical protein
MVCPKDLRSGDPKEYIEEFCAMIVALCAGEYVDVTDVRM